MSVGKDDRLNPVSRSESGEERRADRDVSVNECRLDNVRFVTRGQMLLMFSNRSTPPRPNLG